MMTTPNNGRILGYYWKVFDSAGHLLHRTGRQATPDYGRSLRQSYPTRHGYSVVRVTVRAVPSTVAAPTLLGRIVAFCRSFVPA